ncbi:MAG: radical SAM/SPASM domain-containing protein [Candidatus Bathyarchaeales archaeon]
MGRLAVKLPFYWYFRALGKPSMLPLNYTLSVTYRCNSKCKTCGIWNIQNKVPVETELTLDEWEKVLKSLGESPYWVTISGGEPFLRKDLVEIIGLIERYNKPKILNIPTNGILWKMIPEKVSEILEEISPETTLVLNFSLDGVGKDHDEIRGVPGNYSFLVKAYEGVVNLKKDYPNLVVGIHTVISSWNVHEIPKIYETVMREFNPDQYIAEMAEERNEMENQGKGITPSHEELETALDFLIDRVNDGIKSGRWKGLAKVTEGFRAKYYRLVKNYYKTTKQQIKSYAGFASAQISPVGEVWECAVYASHMGNLRDYAYDFKKLWRSKEAQKVRENVKKNHPCPLANENYTNMLLNPPTIITTIKNIL